MFRFIVLALLLAVMMPEEKIKAENIEGGSSNTHDHNWKYQKEDSNKIIATCENEGCDYGNGIEISVNIGEPTCNKYEGASVTNIDKLDNNLEIIYYRYSEENGKGLKTTEDDDGASREGGIPKNIGMYYAEVIVDGKDIGAKFSIEHEYEPTFEWENENVTVKLKCGKCNNEYTINSDKVEEKIIAPAKCTEDGKKKYTATVKVGNKTFTNESLNEFPIPALGHEYKPMFNWNGNNVTVTLDCIRGDESHNIDPKEIKMTEKITRPATCATKGEITYTASVLVDKEYIDVQPVATNKDPQNHVGGTRIVNAKSATCTVKGYTGDTVCASCGVQRERGSEIPAKGYKWGKGKATKKSTDKSEGVFTYTCTNGCRHTKTEIIPRKSITIDLGNNDKIISNASGCKMSLANASKYKKYLTFNAKTGEVKTKKYYKVKINKSIPVKVKIGGKNYTVKVKIKIPAPKTKEFKISKKNGKDSFGKFCRYTFKYNIKGASKIQVRVVNAKKTGKEKAINKILDRCVKKSKSNKSSYIEFSDGIMKKLKNKNNKVTFKIVVYYGKNQSETLTITK